jgi:ABC-type transport system involved in multi-copper enzyme maturation permease subunit
MAILPLIFLVQPLIQVFALPTTASLGLRHEHALLYMLGIPVLVPAALAAYSVVGERLQGTLEPVLSTPVRSEELLLGKALATFVPSVAVAYGVFALFIILVEVFARSAVASALLQGPDLLAQLVFTPHLATWSIWLGIAVSASRTIPASQGSSPSSSVSRWSRSRRSGDSRQPSLTANDSSRVLSSSAALC